ncbi:hypothetical protein B0H13DRAFT_1908041 [Mycena leptocephala]|nr:hypothetical protein B0H13DRAFT_1908041 [Mycena leptocephala]
MGNGVFLRNEKSGAALHNCQKPHAAPYQDPTPNPGNVKRQPGIVTTQPFDFGKRNCRRTDAAWSASGYPEPAASSLSDVSTVELYWDATSEVRASESDSSADSSLSSIASLSCDSISSLPDICAEFATERGVLNAAFIRDSAHAVFEYLNESTSTGFAERVDQIQFELLGGLKRMIREIQLLCIGFETMMPNDVEGLTLVESIVRDKEDHIFGVMDALNSRRQEIELHLSP